MKLSSLIKLTTIVFFSVASVHANGVCKEGECVNYFCRPFFKGTKLQAFQIEEGKEHLGNFYHEGKVFMYGALYNEKRSELGMFLTESTYEKPLHGTYTISSKIVYKPESLSIKVIDHPVVDSFHMKCTLSRSN